MFMVDDNDVYYGQSNFPPEKPLTAEEIESLQKTRYWALAFLAFITSPVIMNDAIKNNTGAASELYTNGQFMVGLILGIAALGLVLWQVYGMMQPNTEHMQKSSATSSPLLPNKNPLNIQNREMEMIDLQAGEESPGTLQREAKEIIHVI
jgi:hypothetical protein